MVLATWWGWSNGASIALSLALAFVFGYSLTLVPLVRAGTALGAAIGIALVADTFSIVTMEVVDNAVLLVWPGALDAGLADALFWISLAISLAVAWGPTFLVNRALITRGRMLHTCTSVRPSQRRRPSGIFAWPESARQRIPATRTGEGSGVRIGSTWARRCSKAGGRMSASPRCSWSSSTEKPGPRVASSKRIPFGSRK